MVAKFSKTIILQIILVILAILTFFFGSGHVINYLNSKQDKIPENEKSVSKNISLLEFEKSINDELQLLDKYGIYKVVKEGSSWTDKKSGFILGVDKAYTKTNSMFSPQRSFFIGSVKYDTIQRVFRGVNSFYNRTYIGMNFEFSVEDNKKYLATIKNIDEKRNFVGVEILER